MKARQSKYGASTRVDPANAVGGKKTDESWIQWGRLKKMAWVLAISPPGLVIPHVDTRPREGEKAEGCFPKTEINCVIFPLFAGSNFRILFEGLDKCVDQRVQSNLSQSQSDPLLYIICSRETDVASWTTISQHWLYVTVFLLTLSDWFSPPSCLYFGPATLISFRPLL